MRRDFSASARPDGYVSPSAASTTTETNQMNSDFVSYLINRTEPDCKSKVQDWFRIPGPPPYEDPVPDHKFTSYRDDRKRPPQLHRKAILEAAEDYYHEEKRWTVSTAFVLILTVLFYVPAFPVFVASHRVRS